MSDNIVSIGSTDFTIVKYLDERGAGNAFHQYVVGSNHLVNERAVDDVFEIFAEVSFQKGPVKENGVNGCHQEDLLAIVLHRLQCFQEGDFSCRENAIAITKIEEAMMWLNKRTDDRKSRCVEGTSVI